MATDGSEEEAEALPEKTPRTLAAEAQRLQMRVEAQKAAQVRSQSTDLNPERSQSTDLSQRCSQSTYARDSC